MKILKIIVNHENPSSYDQNGFMTSLALEYECPQRYCGDNQKDR